MVTTISVYIALVICVAGLAYKVSTWFRYSIGREAQKISASVRFFAAIKGIILSLLSVKIFTLLKVFILDVVLQIRILREDFLRWLMHMCIYGGFVLLLLMHALGAYVTSALFPDYYSTLNPFLFLRDFFGILIILGLAIAVYRRFVLKVPRLFTSTRDHYAIIIIALIILSGIILEGTKIVSYTAYQQMVEEYSGLDDEQELKALETYWVEKFGVVSPNVKEPFESKVLQQGKELHEASCVMCHSQPQWAFMGYGVALIVKPIALTLDGAYTPAIFWYIHFFACLFGLAYLPFSKMLHIITSPLSLLANSVIEKGSSDPANIATKQVMELDACTHCGTCSVRCSVGVVTHRIPNHNILPSEKLTSVKALAKGKKLDECELKDIQEGVYLCTNCYRCTVVCPVGINLQDLWFTVRETLLQKGYPEALVLSQLSFYRGLMKDEVEQEDYQKPVMGAREALTAKDEIMKLRDKIVPLIPKDGAFQSTLRLSDQAETFAACFGCKTCTAVCPVVANYDNPQQALGLLPHQIMHTCGLGLRDLAFGSAMLWDCLTCYQCQEHCPQGVCVTDVLYELKNLSVKQVKEESLSQVGKML
ncbi:MAG: 4Fe-4S dicluster domain-containing protein [Thermodesulfobacteriota bacterium]|nr:4Fe-4S dicluster domain-containing protein [Thermodesulfobacteriota bacterium]